MGQGLESLQVIEVGGGIAAGMAGKVFADLGATVVKIEAPEGDATRRRGPFRGGRPDPEASGTYLYLNANKRSAVLDLAGAAGRRALKSLAAKAHLLVHDVAPARMNGLGLDYEALAAAHPALVMLSITPYGLTGPFRDYAASDLTLFHGSGWGWMCPGGSTPLSLPPAKPFGQHALLQAGLHGAVAALAACYDAARGGAGEHIDISVVEATAFQLGRHTARYPYTGVSDSRDLPMPYEPFSFFPCKDGWIYIVCPEQEQWNRLVELMGNPAWCDDPRFSSRKGREEHGPELKARLSEWTATQEMEPLFHACQKVRAGAAPVLAYPQIERQEQLTAREFFVTQEHPAAGTLKLPGAPYLLRRPWWRLRSPAPALGEANGSLGALFADNGSPAPARAAAGNGAGAPLAGVRVLDMSWLWTGPHCTLALALLGAEVIKVESSKRPDLTRRSHIFPPELEPGLNRCGYFNQVAQSKQSIGIDLTRPEGIDLVKRLAEASDVMISNFGTGVMERLGLGSEELLRRNPQLTIAAISAFGQTGPLRQYMGYGPLVHAVGGLSAQTGYEDGLPHDIGTAYGDPNGGVFAAFAIAAALWARGRHGGGGQVIDVSMWEAMICTAFEGWMNHTLGNPPYPMMGNRDPYWAPHNLYRCAGEDQWVAIACTGETQWAALCRTLGEAELAEDPRWRDAAARKAHEDALDARIGALCATRDKWEVTRALQAAGVPAFPPLSNAELLDDPHLNARGLFTAWPHPEVGVRKLVGAPWHFTRRPNGHGHAAPLLGEHTDAVLERVLGIDAAERARLREAQVIE